LTNAEASSILWNPKDSNETSESDISRKLPIWSIDLSNSNNVLVYRSK
jgi:hypothetical protein